ncbi:SpoIIIAH-like family protein [Pseudogracilibacillus auburnensis]|nr:SpoIIIAH-like family protein [Pseudogracilibacillus auburnensis]MBO1004296.1 SpoIIIAH-like family protein [Pseudogracilibacillus auburnensis]
MLKKQTVWLLTMLSLMIVLSVYYMMSDTEDIAYINTGNQETEQTVNQDQMDDDVEIEDINEIQSNELFTTIRMELEDERNIKKDRLKEIVASSSATANEINEAINEMDELEKMTTKETILQETILATNENYEDVLVRAEENKVHVHVITDNLPREDAVKIMQMVKDELGEIVVDVNFQATNS